MKTVYTCFCTDIIHEGHLNIIHRGMEYGEVVAGILTDEATIRFNRFPAVSFEERVAMVEAIEGVSRVIVQKEVTYDKVVQQLRPDYIIHGDNWKEGPLRFLRENAKKLMEETGGELIEVPYTRSREAIHKERVQREKLAMPEYRRKRLRQLLKICPIVKSLEVHSGITGLIAEKTIVETENNLEQFDAMWISSLCDSTVKGKPDLSLIHI